MLQEKVDMYIMSNAKYFPSEKVPFLKEKLMTLDDGRFDLLMTIDLKEPTTILIVSLFLGGIGVDRFMLGDTGLGVLKLLTLGVCGIFTFVDFFLVSRRAREKNFTKVMTMI